MLWLHEHSCAVRSLSQAQARVLRAGALEKAMMAQMWNASAGMFCDGTCADTPHTGVTTNAFTLFNDLVPTDSIQGAWEQVRFLTEILDDFRRFVDEMWRF